VGNIIRAVELAQTISASFQSDTDNDGLLGLAMNSINTASPNPVKTFFSNAIPTLASPLFTVNLKKGTPGNYNFGYIDSTEYTGSITYVPVNTANGFWEFTGNGYAIGSGAFVSSSIDAIADTGTTLLYLPTTVVSAYYAKVSGAKYVSSQGGYTYPCSATLPSITLGIGGYKAVVPGSYINYAPATSTSECRVPSLLFTIVNSIQLASVVSSETPELGFRSTETSSSSRNLLSFPWPALPNSGSLPSPYEEGHWTKESDCIYQLICMFPYLPIRYHRSTLILTFTALSRIYHHVLSHLFAFESCLQYPISTAGVWK